MFPRVFTNLLSMLVKSLIYVLSFAHKILKMEKICPFSAFHLSWFVELKFWNINIYMMKAKFSVYMNKSLWKKMFKQGLTLNLLNFIDVIIHLPVLELSIIIIRDIKSRTWSWSANSIEPGQTVRTCTLAWLALYWW